MVFFFLIGLGKVEDVGLGCVGVEFLLANPLIILQTLLELFCIHQEFSKYASNAPNIYLLIIALVANYDFWSGERHAFEFEAVVARSAGTKRPYSVLPGFLLSSPSLLQSFVV